MGAGVEGTTSRPGRDAGRGARRTDRPPRRGEPDRVAPGIAALDVPAGPTPPGGGMWPSAGTMTIVGSSRDDPIPGWGRGPATARIFDSDRRSLRAKCEETPAGRLARDLAEEGRQDGEGQEDQDG